MNSNARSARMEGLLPFIMAGDPGAAEQGLAGLPALLSRFSALGVGTVELGVPHSDPVADGPVLQAAAQRALLAGTTPRGLLEALAGVEACPDLVLFTYFNPLFQLGGDLIGLLRRTPVKALLVVDLPPGEEAAWEGELREAGYPLVPLLTPTTTRERAFQLLQARRDPGAEACFAQRFAYVVARLGVTGDGQAPDLAPLEARLLELQALTERPLAVGFGLDEPTLLERVRQLGATPVIGSALVKALLGGQDLEAFLSPRLALKK